MLLDLAQALEFVALYRYREEGSAAACLPRFSLPYVLQITFLTHLTHPALLRLHLGTLSATWIESLSLVRSSAYARHP